MHGSGQAFCLVGLRPRCPILGIAILQMLAGSSQRVLYRQESQKEANSKLRVTLRGNRGNVSIMKLKLVGGVDRGASCDARLHGVLMPDHMTPASA
jgi:hypothetical protein